MQENAAPIYPEHGDIGFILFRGIALANTKHGNWSTGVRDSITIPHRHLRAQSSGRFSISG